MSADWQVGDLALCIETGEWQSADGLRTSGPQKGAVYTVAALIGDPGGLSLALDEIDPTESAFRACRFRKIRPDEHEACEPEFVTLLKRRKVPLTRETAEQIRRWRQEDADNGIVWEDSTKGRERQRFGDNPLPSDR